MIGQIFPVWQMLHAEYIQRGEKKTTQHAAVQRVKLSVWNIYAK